MKKLIILSLMFFGFQSLSAQIYLTNNEWSQMKALVTQFNINAEKFIDNKDAYVAKDLKKNIWTITSKMNYYSDRIVKAQTFDEGSNMSEKSKVLLTNDVIDHRLIRIEFNNAEVNTIARSAFELSQLKDQLKTKSYQLNMGDPADKALVKKYRDFVNDAYAIQNNNFDKAFKASIN